MHLKFVSSVLAAATVLAVASVPVLARADAPRSLSSSKRDCAAQFEQAQREDMTSFRDFRKAAWRRGHAPDAVSVYPTGERFVGIEAIMDAAENHFADKNAVWKWTELGRSVDGCRSAFIEYETTYDIPSIKFHLRALTNVSYRYADGRWLGVLDQGTLLERTTS
jgi:hypothetical protein